MPKALAPFSGRVQALCSEETDPLSMVDPLRFRVFAGSPFGTPEPVKLVSPPEDDEPPQPARTTTSSATTAPTLRRTDRFPLLPLVIARPYVTYQGLSSGCRQAAAGPGWRAGQERRGWRSRAPD